MKEFDVPAKPEHQDSPKGCGILSDLSFLFPDSYQRHAIEKSHNSVVVTGWDDNKWAVFAFDSLPFLDEDDEEEDDPTEAEEFADNFHFGNGKEGDAELKYSDVPPKEDLIASDPTRSYLVDPPIRDPRLYWLIVLESRVRTISDEWTYLVDKICGRIDIQVCQPAFLWSGLFDNITANAQQEDTVSIRPDLDNNGDAARE